MFTWCPRFYFSVFFVLMFSTLQPIPASKNKVLINYAVLILMDSPLKPERTV
jgi:hypothetical protein